MRKLIQFIMKMAVLGAIAYGCYFAYTEYYSDKNIILRRTEALMDCFEKDTTESYGSAIDTAELSDLLDDEIFFKVEAKKFPFTEFFKEGADKLKILQAHERLSVQTRYYTVLEKRNVKIIKMVPANDGTKEGSEKAPAKAKVEVSLYFRKEAGDRGNILTDIKFDLLFVKKGRSWKVAYVLFKEA